MSETPRRVRGIENRQHADGAWTFRVRWIDPLSGQRLSEEFDDQDDAIDFKRELGRAKRGGRLDDIGKGRIGLAAFVDVWWEKHATRNLERRTLDNYAGVWNKHLLPRIGKWQVRAITAETIVDLRTSLEDSGVRPPTIVKALTMLQSVLRSARTWGYYSGDNPVAMVAKPQVIKGAIKPPAPSVIEAIADQMPTRQERLLVYLIAYERLRPEEALALQDEHIRMTTLLVEQKNVDGEILNYQKVRGKAPRSVRLLRAVMQEVAALRLERGATLPSAYIIRRADGMPWRETDYRNWRRRRWQTAAAVVGAGTITITEERAAGGRTRRRRSYTGPTPYWLRHAGVSLLLREGRMSLAELAEENGHSVQTLLKDYTHVIADLRGLPNIPVEQQIAQARAERARKAA